MNETMLGLLMLSVATEQAFASVHYTCVILQPISIMPYLPRISGSD